MNNQDAIALAKESKTYAKRRHIEIRYHHVRDFVDNDQIDIIYVFNKNQAADEFIKSLNRFLFKIFASW